MSFKNKINQTNKPKSVNGKNPERNGAHRPPPRAPPPPRPGPLPAAAGGSRRGLSSWGGQWRGGGEMHIVVFILKAAEG